jgi:hypothetical protein
MVPMFTLLKLAGIQSAGLSWLHKPCVPTSQTMIMPGSLLFHLWLPVYVGLAKPSIAVWICLNIKFNLINNISASKSAVESFIRTWNNEFGAVQGITVNAITPGPVKYVTPYMFLYYCMPNYPFPLQIWDVGCR